MIVIKHSVCETEIELKIENFQRDGDSSVCVRDNLKRRKMDNVFKKGKRQLSSEIKHTVTEAPKQGGGNYWCQRETSVRTKLRQDKADEVGFRKKSCSSQGDKWEQSVNQGINGETLHQEYEKEVIDFDEIEIMERRTHSNCAELVKTMFLEKQYSSDMTRSRKGERAVLKKSFKKMNF